MEFRAIKGGGGYNFRWYHQTFVPFGEYVLGRYMILAWKEEGSRSSGQPPKYGIVLKWLYLSTNETEIFNSVHSKSFKTPSFWSTCNINYSLCLVPAIIREGSGYQIGWIFGKIPNGLRPPFFLIFGKLFCNFFYDRYGCIYARRYDGQII